MWKRKIVGTFNLLSKLREDSFPTLDVGASVVKNVVENLGYYIRLNDETRDPFTEQTEPAKLLFSFLEILPVLGKRWDHQNMYFVLIHTWKDAAGRNNSCFQRFRRNVIYVDLFECWLKDVLNWFRLPGVPASPWCIECFEGISRKCEALFRERGGSAPAPADPALLELAAALAALCRNIAQAEEYSDLLATQETTYNCTSWEKVHNI